jgi:DNA-binding NtrC family response regulator
MCQRTVLIVEDEVLIRMMLADVLDDTGYRVIEAGNVLEAVAALGRYDIDTVITDIDMPGGLNGLDLARMVSSTHQNTTVIVTSGGHRLSPHELPDRARFIPKPYRLDVIAAMVGEMTVSNDGRLAS